MKQKKYYFIATFYILFCFCLLEAFPIIEDYINTNKEQKRHLDYHYGYKKGLVVKITPDTPEFVAGTIGTFTVSITNISKNSIDIKYPTGQQWDMAIYYNGLPIFQWSEPYRWNESPNTITLRPGETRSEKLAWSSMNYYGQPLSQGIYKCIGLVTCSPKIIVSNESSFRLLPPSVIARKTIKTKLNQCFEIELPRFANDEELVWKIVYIYNDNRISYTNRKLKDKSIVITFLPKRLGHVNFDLYAYPKSSTIKHSLERRSYRVEVD